MGVAYDGTGCTARTYEYAILLVEGNMIARPVFIVGELDRLAPNEVARALGHPTTQGTVLDAIVAARNNGIPTEEPAMA